MMSKEFVVHKFPPPLSHPQLVGGTDSPLPRPISLRQIGISELSYFPPD